MDQKLLSHRFYTIGRVENGHWLAISTSAPYFCFEGESAEAVRNTANRALNFYFGVKGRVTTPVETRRRTRTLSTFSPVKRVEHECVDA